MRVAGSRIEDMTVTGVHICFCYASVRPVAREKRGSWYMNGFSIDDDEHQHPKSQASARGLKEGLTPAGLAVASRHHPGESGRRGSCVGGQGSGGACGAIRV